MLSSSMSHMCWRPIQYSPPGISTMSGGADWLNRGSADRRQIKTVSAKDRLFKQRSNLIVADEFGAAERSRLDVLISALGRRVVDALCPIDAESRIDAGNNVIHIRLLAVRPTRFHHFRRFCVGFADHSTTLDTAADPQRRVGITIVIAAGNRIHPGCSAELARANNQSLIQ